jgi:hypothetical protein
VSPPHLPSWGHCSLSQLLKQAHIIGHVSTTHTSRCATTHHAAVTHVLQVDGLCYALLCVIHTYRPLKCHLPHYLVTFCILHFGICVIWLCFHHLQHSVNCSQYPRFHKNERNLILWSRA